MLEFDDNEYIGTMPSGGGGGGGLPSQIAVHTIPANKINFNDSRGSASNIFTQEVINDIDYLFIFTSSLSGITGTALLANNSGTLYTFSKYDNPLFVVPSFVEYTDDSDFQVMLADINENVVCYLSAVS